MHLQLRPHCRFLTVLACSLLVSTGIGFSAPVNQPRDGSDYGQTSANALTGLQNTNPPYIVSQQITNGSGFSGDVFGINFGGTPLLLNLSQAPTDLYGLVGCVSPGPAGLFCTPGVLKTASPATFPVTLSVSNPTTLLLSRNNSNFTGTVGIYFADQTLINSVTPAATIPEPATVSFILLGALALLGRQLLRAS